MKLLENKTNITAPDADYPFGSVRDKTPSLAGTIWNFETMSDIIQFFSKMFNESGLTANNLPDNNTNGFQLFEAFLTIFGGVKRKIINIGDWDMDTDATVAVAHGVTDFTKVRNISVMILDDSGTVMLPLDLYSGSVVMGGVFNLDATDVTLVRTATGIFDDPGFNSISYNRGYITIDFID